MTCGPRRWRSTERMLSLSPDSMVMQNLDLLGLRTSVVLYCDKPKAQATRPPVPGKALTKHSGAPALESRKPLKPANSLHFLSFRCKQSGATKAVIQKTGPKHWKADMTAGACSRFSFQDGLNIEPMASFSRMVSIIVYHRGGS